MMEGKELKVLTMDELTEVVHLYPWFGAARKELCQRMAKLGGSEWGTAQYADAAMYLPARDRIFDILRSTRKEDCSDKDVAELLKAYIEPNRPESSPQGYRRTVRVIGGDFFSQNQYDAVRREEDDIFTKFVALRTPEAAAKDWEDAELGFCTETLAQVYAEQGYYPQAKKIYSKLILRYPEKSAYFATLVEKLEPENINSEI